VSGYPLLQGQKGAFGMQVSPNAVVRTRNLTHRQEA
jgi:hypothetical protein